MRTGTHLTILSFTYVYEERQVLEEEEGRCKSIANQWKLLYTCVFGSKVAICMGGEFDK